MSSNVNGNVQSFVTGFMPLRSSNGIDVSSEPIAATNASDRTITPVWTGTSSTLAPIKSTSMLASGIVIASRSAASSSVPVFGPRPTTTPTQETNDRLDRILEAALPMVIPTECIVQTSVTPIVAPTQVNPVLPSFTDIASPPLNNLVEIPVVSTAVLPNAVVAVNDAQMAIDLLPANVVGTESVVIASSATSSSTPKPEPQVIHSSVKVASNTTKKQTSDSDYELPARIPLRAKRHASSITAYVPPFKVLQLGLSSGDTPDTLHAYLYDCSYTKDVKLRTTADALKDMLRRLNPKAEKDFADIQTYGPVAADNTASQFALTLTKTAKQRSGGRRGYMDKCGRSIFLVHREEPSAGGESQSPPAKKPKASENPS